MTKSATRTCVWNCRYTLGDLVENIEGDMPADRLMELCDAIREQVAAIEELCKEAKE